MAPAEMLAVRLAVPDRRLLLQRVPVPEPGPGQVRLRVMAAGVCLSDAHLLDGTLTPAHLDGDLVTLGHEVAGVVDALGEGVRRLRAGQRVLLQAGEFGPGGRILTRGFDYDGGWAEYCLARAGTAVPIPDSLPFEQACIIPDAVSTPWSALTTPGQLRPGQAVGVWGLGGLGTHAVQLARLIGAAPIVAVDPVAGARERALALGADLALDPADDVRAAVREVTDGRGVDLALDVAGVPAVREQALRVLADGGRLVLVGIAGGPVTIPQDAVFTYRRQSITGAYGSTPEHVLELVRFTRFGRLDLSGSVSAVLPLARAEEALADLVAKRGNPIRIVLTP